MADIHNYHVDVYHVNVPQLQPLTGPQMIYEYGKPQWNGSDKGKLNSKKKPLPVPLCPL
jgi:hypothetical protein